MTLLDHLATVALDLLGWAGFAAWAAVVGALTVHALTMPTCGTEGEQ